MQQVRIGVATIVMVVGVSAGVAGAQTVLREARFDAATEGWGVVRLSGDCASPLNALTGTVTFQATGGNPGGQLQHIPPSEGRLSYWSAPASFIGDLSAAEGGVLSFDSRQSGSTGGQVNKVILQGNGQTLFYTGWEAPRVQWRRFHVLLASSAGWHVGSCTGPAVTSEEFSAVLANVTGLYIHCEYGSAATNDGLDNVIISGLSPASPSSTFDKGLEDWWIYYDANYPTWNAKQGNPGGCLHVVDRVEGDCWRLVAPAKYLGDHRETLGGTLRFDLRAPGERACGENSFVEIRGAGMTLEFDLASLSGSQIWRAYTVPLAPAPAWRRSIDGQPATLADFERVLEAVASLSIRGEFVSGNDNAYFDNVMFGSCEPSVVVAVGGGGVCVNHEATLTSTVGGSTPLAYQWRMNGEPIDPFMNPTAATSTLVIDMVRPGDAGTYDMVVTNECGVETSNRLVIEICDADFNCDGVVNSQDFFDFLTAFFNMDGQADFNADHLINSQDFFDFLTAFFGGC